MNCKPIGMVKSPVTEGTDKDWGKIVSEIYLDKELASGLKGIDSFSYIIVIFDMDRSTWDSQKDIVRRPRGRKDMPLLGIFAQRAKHRPNPIGVTSVKLLEVKGNVLKVQGLDAIDGTPVLDIKPYFPQYDMRADSRRPDWVDRLMEDYF